MEDEDRLSIWLSRNIGRSDAERALQGQRDGVFLVRASVSAPGDYVISVVFGGIVQHHQIKHYKGRMVTQSGRELNSLAELIRHYKSQADGLSAPLATGCKAYDPPRPSAPKPPVPRRDPGIPPLPRRSVSQPEVDSSKYEIAASRISLISAVGSGQFGQVYEAWLAPKEGGDNRGQLVAVKTCKQDHDTKHFMQEAILLQRFNHPNVLALVGTVTSQDPIMLVLEYVPYGDMRAVLKACRVKNIAVHLREKLWMATQIAAGMEHLASRKCIHRDLAARNVLLGQYCACKIADFGLSRQLEEDSDYYRSVSHSILPIKWMAPECLDGRVFTTANDIWSFGVVLWEIMSLAKTPFKRETTGAVTHKIKEGERLPIPKDCPDNVYAIMRNTWNADPKLRPNFGDLHMRLNGLHTAAGDAPPRDIGAMAQDKPGAPETQRQSWEFPRDELRYVKDLGEGEFGRVVLMSVSSSSESVSQKMVAVKILADNANAEASAAFEKEMRLLMDLNFQHPNVITLLGVSVTEEPHMLIMEYMNLGDLQGLLRDNAPSANKPAGLTTEDLLAMAVQIAAGCGYLASRDFVHRDIAARNCLVGTGNVVKIADFGLGRTLEHSDYYKTQGGVLPLRWMAPETVLYGKFSSCSDVWAFAVVLWEMFSFGQQPLNHLTNLQIVSALTSNTPPPHKMPPECPPLVADLVRQCHAVSPDSRPTFSAIEKSLRRVALELPDDGESDLPPEPPMRRQSSASGASGDAPKIVKQGWLTKQGGGSTPFGRTNWKRRWFILYSDSNLVYLKTGRPKEQPLGVINLLAATRVRSEPAFETSFEAGCCFSLSLPDRTFCLVSDVGDEQAEWIRVLSSFVKP